MTLSDFASRLHKPKWGDHPTLGQMVKSSCPCPGHGKGRGDRTASFAVWEGADGWLHMKCQAGCSEGDILSSLGLTESDRRVVPYDPSRVTHGTRAHRYTTVQGAYLFTKMIERENEQSAKKVSQFIDNKGKREYSLSGIGDLRKTLYRISEVAKAVTTGQTIYINEGENACDAFAERALVATCQPAGAGPGKWLPMHSDTIAGASEVVIVADRDEVGEAYAREVASALKHKVGAVKVVQSATTRPSDDAFDHFEAGHTIKQFVPRPDLALAPPLEVEEISDSDIDNYAVEFLWEPYLRKGKCVLLDADGGTGKTSVAIAMAAAMSCGHEPWGSNPSSPVRTLYLHKGEDDSTEISLVFRANGGERDNFIIPKIPEGATFNASFLDRLEATIVAQQINLVIVDALFYFIGQVVKDVYRSTDCLPVMEQLNGIAARTNCTFLNIRHTTKGSPDRDASTIGMGSVQFRNSHRGQIVLRWHPEERGVIVMTDEKGSLLVERGEPLAFRRVGYEIQRVSVDLEKYERGPASTDIAGNAEEWLVAYLTDAVTAKVTDVMADGLRQRGFSRSTLFRVAQKLGIVANGQKRSVWSLPTDTVPHVLPTQETLTEFDPFA